MKMKSHLSLAGWMLRATERVLRGSVSVMWGKGRDEKGARMP